MKLINRIWYYLANLGVWRAGSFIVVISVLVKIALVVALHPYRDLERYELERTAISLANTGVFGNPYALPTGPTAHVSPGYPILLAAIFRVFGEGVSGEIVKEMVAILVSSCGYALLPWAAERLLQVRTVGTVGGLICAVFPWKPLVQIDGDWETPYTALFLTILVPLTLEIWRRKHLSLRTSLAYGLIWGSALLFASVLLPLLLVFAVLGAWFCRGLSLRSYSRFTALQLAIAALCVVPWIIRNEMALGSPIVTRSNLGLELRVSNNSDATADQRENFLRGVYGKYHPLQNSGEAERVAQLGEVAYNRWAGDEAKAWIRSHRARFAALTLKRIQYFWLYPEPSKAKALAGYVTALLGLNGLIWTWRRDAMSGAILTTTFAVYSAPSYLIQVGSRQRYPIDWALVLLSVAAVYWFMRQQVFRVND